MPKLEGDTELLKTHEVADLCNVSPETIRRLTDSGAMPKPVRLGRAVRYRKSDVLIWIEKGCPKTLGKPKRR